MTRTFVIHSFGCKVNQEEGEALSALFAAQGWRELGLEEEAALYVVNTCTVTHRADSKARKLIRKLRAEHPAALLAVTGCYAQAATEAVLALEGVDIICGLQERAQLPQLVEKRIAEGRPQVAVADIQEATGFTTIGPARRQKRARAYLKIEDGCDQFCHYCIIPHARGPVRSLPLAQALEQAGRLIEVGHQEIVLSGIHIGAYGEDLPEGEDLPALIRGILARAEGRPFRLRLGSIEPQQFSEPLLELIGSETRICPHLHIPLQSGCDAVLAAMNRHYNTAQYHALIECLRTLRPGLALSSDVIVGYPGERAAHFQQTLAFVREISFARLHVFPYSKRQGTVAATLPQQVPEGERKQRVADLSALAEEMALDYAERCLREQPELDFLYEQTVELAGRRYALGHSGNYLCLLLPEEQAGQAIRSVVAECCDQPGDGNIYLQCRIQN